MDHLATPSPEVSALLQQLEDKYAASGQDFKAYLEGLVHQQYVTYWDYINLDALLSLQTPRSVLPDESIFIMYHQITELYFKLCRHELAQISERYAIKSNEVGEQSADFLVARVGRIVRYFGNLTQSFAVMVDGMEVEQFLAFRMALLPASGFQSAQYRMIELGCTHLRNLVHHEGRATLLGSEKAEELMELVYWKRGATEKSTGAKTLTLRQFEDKYGAEFLRLAHENEQVNLAALYERLPASEQAREDLTKALRALDQAVNIEWPLQHYRSAVRYLSPANTGKGEPQGDSDAGVGASGGELSGEQEGDAKLNSRGESATATGGTNWQQYLPPRFQFRIFFPSLWREEERKEWGRRGAH